MCDGDTLEAKSCAQRIFFLISADNELLPVEFHYCFTTMLESLAYCQSFKGYGINKHKSSIWTHPQAISQICRSSISMLCSYNKQGAPLSHSFSHKICHGNSGSKMFCSTTSIAPTLSGWKGLCFSKYRQLHWERFRVNVAYDVAGAVEVMNDLGLDTLTFLAVTVLIVPTFKLMKASPVRSPC